MRTDDLTVKPSLDAAMSQLLVSAVSQGIRTPLHSLLGFLELLATADLDDEARRLMVDARAGGEDLLAASDRVVLLLHLLGGGAPTESVRFCLDELLRDVAVSMGPQCDVLVEVNRFLPATVHGDVEALRHLLIEVAGSVVREGGRRLAIYAERSNPFTDSRVGVRFTVYDRGRGLPAEAVHRLAPPAADAYRDTRNIGAILTQELVARLDGALTANYGTGHGAAAVLEVAVAEPGSAAAEEPAGTRREPVAEHTGLRVLLVEDNPVNRILTERQMKRLGHHLDTVATGLEGVDRALSGRYDAVLMDIHLPDIDGIEATRRIRAGEEARHTPIIALTADASPGHREQCLAAGMNRFLTKPLDLDTLRTELTAATRHSPDPAASTTEPDFDAAVLRQLSSDLDADPGVIAELVDAFLQDMPSRRLRLQVALRQPALREAAAAAESLRAASQVMGAVRLAEVCRGIRIAADQGDLTEARALLPTLKDTCQSTMRALQMTTSALRN